VRALGESLKKLVGARVRDTRKSRGLTQQGLAERVGLSVNMIGYIERGEKFPSAETFQKLAAALKCGVQDFFKPSLTNHAGNSEREAALKQLEQLLSDTPSTHIKAVNKILSEIKKLN
jgi:transcriptional regulator with XRE-family HTH domain